MRQDGIEIAQAATPEEAAAIAAGVEQFLRDTAPSPSGDGEGVSPWLAAGLLEGTGRDPAGGVPWGRNAP